MYNLAYYCMYIMVLSLGFLSIFHILSGANINKSIILFIIGNTSIGLIFVMYGKHFLLMPFTTIILLFYCLKNVGKLNYSIFLVILTDLVFALSDAVVGFCAAIFFNINFNIIPKVSLEYLIIALIIVILSCVISAILRRIFAISYIYDDGIVKKLRNNVPILLYIGFVLCNIYIDVFAYKYFVRNIDNFVITLNACSTAINFIVVIIVLYFYRKDIMNKLQCEFKDLELQRLSEYTNMIEKMTADLKKFKHDYNNIMTILSSYIEREDINGLKYFYENELELENKKMMKMDSNLYLLKNIQMSSLKGLLSSKIINATSKKIKVVVEILDPIEKLHMAEIDICRIIGILLDNAIEAAELCDDKFINLTVVKQEKNTTFIIRNSCSEDTPSVYMIYRDNFSTKGNGRGLGLNIVRTIIEEKYANVFLHTKVKDLIFQQELVIRNTN
ncbi:GHKL domain-containing protein [Clostridium sp. YIM B02505]|uniref:GHKL domain-containing protein n=1 Tax=Clostridium yunnanense TaxID=2800325 RepID=A0ABS1EWH7_9CLOT|nr:GHKL domain-containing protein [Clostridium yunnanense]MBK1813743.1 GHKL domain-containing protein [Clostridium yunnanense]